MRNPAVKKLYAALRRHIPPQSRVLLAVSGGADSLALADVAALLRDEGRLEVMAAHVEHGLRGQEALEDAAAVERFCRARHLPYRCLHVQAAAYAAAHKRSLEAAARALRYAALRWAAADYGAECIVTAHHRDDQAETVLLRLLRGTSPSGLGGMAVRSRDILRPFLHLGRDDLERYCRARGIAWRHDSSNDDPAHTRNRVRLELLPCLERSFNPAVRRALTQAAELLREDEDFFAALVSDEAGRRVTEDAGCLLVDVSGWRELAAPVRKRLLRQCYFRHGGGELGYAHTQALDGVCLAGRSGKALQLPGGIRAAYAYQKLRLSRAAEGQPEESAVGFCVSCRYDNGPQTISYPGGSATIRLVRTAQAPLAADTVVYPEQLLSGPEIHIRSRHRGDRFTPRGGAGGKKLKDYFIDRKLPRERRDAQALVACGDRILGIAGMANAAWERGAYDSWLTVKFTQKE